MIWHDGAQLTLTVSDLVSTYSVLLSCDLPAEEDEVGFSSPISVSYQNLNLANNREGKPLV